MEPAPVDFASGELSGKRRWKWSTDPVFYSFEEYLEYCKKENFMKFDREEGVRSVRGGALYLWRMAYDEEYEEEVAGRRAEDVRSLQPVPFQALVPPGAVEALLQCAAPPPGLVGPSKGGGCLRLAKTGIADCWGGAGPRSAMTIEVVQSQPVVIARIRAFTGALLRSWDVAAGKGIVDFSGEDEDLENTLFEFLPRASSGEELTTLVSVVPKGGHTSLGTFALYAAPAYLTSHHIDLEFADDILGRLGERARALAQAEPEFQGRRRHRQDTLRRHYSFEDMLKWAAQKFHTTQEQEALDLGRAVWRFMCVDELEEGGQAKRSRGPASEPWSVVFQAPALEEGAPPETTDMEVVV